MVLDKYLRGRARLWITLDYTKIVSEKDSRARREKLKSGSCLKNMTVHGRTSNYSHLMKERLLKRNAQIKIRCAYEQKRYMQIFNTWWYVEKVRSKELTHFCVITLFFSNSRTVLKLRTDFSRRHRNCAG